MQDFICRLPDASRAVKQVVSLDEPLACRVKSLRTVRAALPSLPFKGGADLPCQQPY